MNKKWQEFEDNVLRDFYPKNGFNKCFDLLNNRTEKEIKNRIHYLNLKNEAYDPQKLLERFLKEIKERGGTPLFDVKEWKYCKSRYLVRCSCGYEWKVQPTALWTRGNWCKACSGYKKKTSEDYHNIAAKFGGIWLENEAPKNNKTDTRWRCSQGHEFYNDFNNIQQYGCFCRYCKSPYLGQTVTKMYLEILTGLTFQTVKPEFLTYTTGFRLELDGYNKQKEIAFEYNGIEHHKKSNRQSQQDFEDLQKRDKWKHEKVRSRNIRLLVIDEINGKFDEEHIKKSIISFLEKESIAMVIDPVTASIDFSSIYSNYDLKIVKEACNQLNFTLISDTYINSNTKVKIKCNDCKKEKSVIPATITYEARKDKKSYCRCVYIKNLVEKYNSIIEKHGFKIISNNYANNKTPLTIEYPDGSKRIHSWMQFYWDHLPRYLNNLNKK